MANVGNQLPTQAVSKPPSGKHGNVLPLWGNEKTMNLNPMILTNVLSSPYFKVQLYELKTYHEVVDEIYFKVTHIEPWEKGSRKTAGQTGMCGGVRGVGTGGIVSTAFCLLYKLFTLKLTRKQLMGLITHTDSPYIRALGFMYIRYTQPPTDLLDWYDGFLDDEEDLDVKAGGGCVMTIGEMLRSFLTKLEWFSTLFPRIPVPVQKMIDQNLKARPRKVAQKDPQEEEAPAEAGRQGERRHSRTPRRTPSPRRSPKRSRSRSHHREKDRHGPSYDRELERERDRQRKEREGKDRDRGDRERRRSRSADRNQDRRERKRSHSSSRDRRSERREKERDGGEDRNRKKERDHHKDRGADRERSRDRKSRAEVDERRHKDDRDRHREEKKTKRSSRSRSRDRKHKEDKSRKRERSHSREKDRERDGEARSHKRSRSKEKSHHQRESSNDHAKHSDRRRSQSTE
ncbi:Pre-mRNA-splicing factor 38B [Oryzias melastigma]|uniref:Pre-mRNA-splicing factor 38B n=1 Tax=Oryzias melastigma TaxID=30732 RepID=A0A3B3CQR2_ORYME|nr:pre-mRNA-splicing factor 38B [Oryzias melastigma]KAF6729011.1 Pre-mRNA-splicing factor 38B [Oryzias melastigma]